MFEILVDYTPCSTMNIGVLKLYGIYYSYLTITNYTSNERVIQTVSPTSIRGRAHALDLRLPLEAL